MKHHAHLFACSIIALGAPQLASAQTATGEGISTMALDRVEVLRDGASAQYGSDAVAGVINGRYLYARVNLSWR